MKTMFAILFASIYGLSLRILFGLFSDLMGVMSISFLILLPFVIGFLTIILMPQEKTTSGVAAFFKPWLTCLVILFVTILLKIEGSICWIMIYPLFAILSGFGGLLAYYTRKKRADENSEEKDDWEKPGALQISFALLIPVLLGFAEGDRTQAKREYTIRQEIVIPASPETVWKQLTSADQAASNKSRSTFSHALGFPRYLQTRLDKAEPGGKRIASYEKGLMFEETISKCEPGRLLLLEMKTDPSKIPPGVMDEHIVIGGKHVDIMEDEYKLESLPGGNTRLSLSSRFFISTPFNWYAGIWAHYLMNDILKEQLAIIKERATK